MQEFMEKGLLLLQTAANHCASEHQAAEDGGIGSGFRNGCDLKIVEVDVVGSQAIGWHKGQGFQNTFPAGTGDNTIASESAGWLVIHIEHDGDPLICRNCPGRNWRSPI